MFVQQLIPDNSNETSNIRLTGFGEGTQSVAHSFGSQRASNIGYSHFYVTMCIFLSSQYMAWTGYHFIGELSHQSSVLFLPYVSGDKRCRRISSQRANDTESVYKSWCSRG